MKKILIVTEQPINVVESSNRSNALGLQITECKGTIRCWGKLNNHHPFCHVENNMLAERNKWSSFLKTMKYLLQYLQSKSIHYYWTHYIKCPGNFKESENKNFFINDCADMWLEKEVTHYKPNVIFTIGQYASEYIVGKPFDKFSKYIGKDGFFYKYNPKIKVILLPHPSGRSPIFNEWRKNNYLKLIKYVDYVIQ